MLQQQPTRSMCTCCKDGYYGRVEASSFSNRILAKLPHPKVSSADLSTEAAGVGAEAMLQLMLNR